MEHQPFQLEASDHHIRRRARDARVQHHQAHFIISRCVCGARGKGPIYLVFELHFPRLALGRRREVLSPVGRRGRREHLLPHVLRRPDGRGARQPAFPAVKRRNHCIFEYDSGMFSSPGGNISW